MSSRLISNSLVSFFSFLVGTLTIFVLYKYILNVLGAEQLGLWTYIISLTSLSAAGGSIFSGSMVKFVAKYDALSDNQGIAEVIETNSFVFLIISILFVGSFYKGLNYYCSYFFSGELEPLALIILPIICFSFFLNFNSQTFLLSIDGHQQYVISQSIRLVGKVIFLLGSLLSIGSYGLVGLAYSYLISNLFLLLAAFIAIRKLVSFKGLNPFKFSKSKFSEMLQYGLRFQFISLAQLSLMPILKFSIKTVSGYSFLAYFEMAYQLVTTLKGALTSLLNVLVPLFANLEEVDLEQSKKIYYSTVLVVIYSSILLYALVALFVPIISNLWIGDLNKIFIYSAVILLPAFVFSSIAEPQYLNNLGSGDLRPNMIAMVTAFISLIIGVSLFKTFLGDFSIVIIYSLSAILSNIVLLQLSRYNIVSKLVNTKVISLLTMNLAIIYYYYSGVFSSLESVSLFAICAVTLAFVVLNSLTIFMSGIFKEILLQYKLILNTGH